MPSRQQSTLAAIDMERAPIIVIPARFGSTRLPGKMLREIKGIPLIAHTVIASLRCGWAVQVVTDDEQVAKAAHQAGAQTTLTRTDHTSGTDRIAEVAERFQWPDDQVVVNVQGDEPLMPPALVRQVAETLANDQVADLSTAATPIADVDTWLSPDVVKVVRDSQGRALYFSRAAIPHNRDGEARRNPEAARRHIGIYAYRVAALRRLSAAPVAELETLEKLEQLRALTIGQIISVVDACDLPGPGVDVEADLGRVNAAMQQLGIP